jgi:hypothetical protein
VTSQYVDVAQGTGLYGLLLQALGLDADIRNSDRYYEADMRDAERQYQLDLQRFGLQVANTNFAQREAAATKRLESLGLLTSLQGPGDWVRYNYVLNDLDPPDGRVTDPLGAFSDIDQPFAFSMPPATATGTGTPKPGAGTTTWSDPARPVASETARAPQAVTAPAPVAATTPAAAPAATAANPQGLIPVAAAAAPVPAPARTWTADPEPDRGGFVARPSYDVPRPSYDVPTSYYTPSPAAAPAPTAASLPVAQRQLLRAADGGMVGHGQPVVVGDPKQGSDRPNPEVAMQTPMGLLVVPLSDLGMDLDDTERLPKAATGGVFPNTAYDPGVLGGIPAVQQLMGTMSTRRQQGKRGEALGPLGASPFSFTNYMGLLPSAQAMVRGYIDTPQSQGGLGGVFEDELERSRRAAATGVSTGAAMYGG